MGVLVGPRIRVVTLRMRGAEGMKQLGRGSRHERVEHFGGHFWIGPIPCDTCPLRAKPFLIVIAILDDESPHPLRMRQEDAETYRPAVVMKVEAAFVDLELLEKTVGRFRQVVEGVRIRRWRRGVTLTESRKIRRYQMIACCE